MMVPTTALLRWLRMSRTPSATASVCRTSGGHGPWDGRVLCGEAKIDSSGVAVGVADSQSVVAGGLGVSTNRMEPGEMTINRKLLHYALRKRRTSLASTTLLASSSSRRGAFSSAIQQFEELMGASAAVGPASRPITLYYATVQAGLAVAAAHKPDPVWALRRPRTRVP